MNCVLFNENGNRILTGGSDFLLQVHDLETGTSVFRYKIHKAFKLYLYHKKNLITKRNRKRKRVYLFILSVETVTYNQTEMIYLRLFSGK